MSEVLENLKYTKDHEWVKPLDDNTALVGITDYAQQSLGDITFVELPQVGASVNRGDNFGVVESVKAASDLFMPISGEILEINESLDAFPELVNTSAFEDGWMLKVKLTSPDELAELMDHTAYSAII